MRKRLVKGLVASTVTPLPRIYGQTKIKVKLTVSVWVAEGHKCENVYEIQVFYDGSICSALCNVNSVWW